MGMKVLKVLGAVGDAVMEVKLKLGAMYDIAVSGSSTFHFSFEPEVCENLFSCNTGQV